MLAPPFSWFTSNRDKTPAQSEFRAVAQRAICPVSRLPCPKNAAAKPWKADGYSYDGLSGLGRSPMV